MNFLRVNTIAISSITSLIKIFSGNAIIKEVINNTLNKRKLKLKKPILTQKEKFELLIEFVEQFKRLPYFSENYKDIYIGHWFMDKKIRIKSTDDTQYKELSTNSIIKTHLDNYLERRKEPKESKKIKIV